MPASFATYSAHVAARAATTARALEETGFDRLLIHSGVPFTYFADDNDAPFHSTPHFAHWAPVDGPHHLLDVRPGRGRLLVRATPQDYWYEPPQLGHPFWIGEFDCEVTDEAAAWKAVALGQRTRTAYVGDAPASAEAHGIARARSSPAKLVARLDWDRSTGATGRVPRGSRAHGRAQSRRRARRVPGGRVSSASTAAYISRSAARTTTSITASRRARSTTAPRPSSTITTSAGAARRGTSSSTRGRGLACMPRTSRARS